MKPFEIGEKVWRHDPNSLPFGMFDRRIEPTGIRWVLWVLRGRPESQVRTIKGMTPRKMQQMQKEWLSNH